jgi:dTDP-4-dehydrorhamnose reductase
MQEVRAAIQPANAFRDALPVTRTMPATGPILVAGSRGRVARFLAEEGASLGLPVRALGRPDLDIEDSESIARVLASLAPRAIINAAGCVVVDEAERNPASAFAINRDAAAGLARAAAHAGIPFLHVSSDYVFDGHKRAPYLEDDPVHPLSVYGRSKAEGEQAVLAADPAAFVLRTSWVYGTYGTNFVTSMLRQAKSQEVVRVVSDQYGTPTAGPDLARAMLAMTTQLLEGGATPQEAGIYHVAGAGETTWLGFAEAIFETWARLGHRVPRIEPISVTDWPGPAQRPTYSCLDCSKVARAFGIRLPDWRARLEACVEQLHRAVQEGTSPELASA